MKKIYFVFTVLTLPILANSQPVIDKLFDFQSGDEYVFRKLAAGQSLDTSMFQSRGTGLTWNMSALNLEPTIYRDTVLSPASSAFPASFPTATYVFKEHSGLQQYYRKRNDTVMYLGSNYGGVPTAYNPGGITVILPATYAASGNNIFASTPTTIPGGATWTYYGRYNAYGTLTLPGGVTVPNVGLYVVSGGDGGLRFTDYMWAVAGRKDPVVRIQFRHQSGQTTVEHMYVSNSALNPTAVLTTSRSSAAKLVVYPNPAADVVNLSLDGAIGAVRIYDMLGGIVLQTKSANLNISKLVPGTYGVVASYTDGEIVRGQFIIKR
jgi:hypothetical protein